MVRFRDGRADLQCRQRDGIGFALQGSGIAAFDVDDCRNAASGELHPWASGLIARCGTYAEITPSGTGVRIIGTAAGPKVHRKLAVPGADGVSVELYRNAERYICVTGVQIGDAAQLSNIDAHINTAMADLAGPKLAGKREHNLEALVRDGCGDDFGGDRSRAVWYVVNQLLKDGKSADDVVAVLLDRANGISAHVYDQSKPEAYARRQVEKAQRQAEKTTTPSKDKRPAKDILIELAQNAELFHTADGVSYADFVIHNHRETWPVRAKGFKRWLGRLYYEETSSAPNSEAMQSALGIIEACAHYDAPERPIATRLAELDGRIYIDLCNADWQAIEIDEDGWRVVDEPPVRFRRAGGMLPLPTPQRGGHVNTLRKYLNLTATGAEAEVEADAKFVLTVSALVAYLRARGPYPVLVLVGEHGTCKSTFVACAHWSTRMRRRYAHCLEKIGTCSSRQVTDGYSRSTMFRNCRTGSRTRSVVSLPAADLAPASCIATMTSSSSPPCGRSCSTVSRISLAARTLPIGRHS